MILHFLLSNCFFASENYDNFSDVLDKFIKTDNLLRKNQDKLFYDSSFYTDFALYNAIWAGFKDTQTIIASLNKREYDYIQRFFSRTFSAANTDSFEEFEQQNMLNKGIVGWYKGVFLKDKFMATIEDWYHLHYLHFQQNQDDTSYFIYSEDKHLEIENTLLSESYNYLPAIPQLQYIDIPRPNNPNGGNGLFMVEEEFYFIFPNLHISNLLKSWHLIYAKEENRTEDENTIYNREFGGLNTTQIATNFAKEVAEANFYTYTDSISKHNKKHNKNAKTTPYEIYERGQGKHQTFLSVDFGHAKFEVLNYKGEHIGEYGFDGKIHHKADQKGGHDILIP